MMLVGLIGIPFLGAMAAWMVGGWNRRWPRGIALGALVVDLLLGLSLWMNSSFSLSSISVRGGGHWLREVSWAWVPRFGIYFHLAIDGLSLLLILLTALLGMVAVLSSWEEIKERTGFFYFNLLLVLAGIMGVFLSLDLFLFYFFWEIMLIPMYFLIVIWGHEHRLYAAIKFFLFTQLSSLLMLLAILGLYFIHGRQTGVYTFDYEKLLGTSLSPAVSMWLMLGFFVAFAVKLPAFLLHTWLPDAHSEAPTAGSVILAGLLLKTGAYGLLRFVVPLFPEAAMNFAPWAMVLATAGILYGAVLAFAQTDLKRLVAYTSVSHMGFVLLGIFAWNRLALQGVVLQIICHGLSTGALFVLAGFLYERIHTRDVRQMGGLWTVMPCMGAVGLFFAMASLGLPGLGNFIAEFLVLIGSYPVSPALTVLATVGLVFATVYALWMIQRIFHGPNENSWKGLSDLSVREIVTMAVMMVALVGLGVYPRPVLKTAEPALIALERSVTMAPPQTADGRQPSAVEKLKSLEVKKSKH